ncbi:MAG: FG-GAP-like repeat-containing protein [Bacteroidales bacterium]|nr:FG-GAP-like repeat-containing protein [Bacteroidales bacterium]MCF8405919.1 FG-GAP-like repeat-containing protein [Bacteroidales bacterium]
MDTPESICHTLSRSIFLIPFLLLVAFIHGDTKSEYILPIEAYSVCANDLDLDGDMDIIVGHNYNSQTQWSGVSILLNEGNGMMVYYDSVNLFGGQTDVKIKNFNQNPIPEIIGKYVELEPENELIAVINNLNTSNISFFSLNTNEGVAYIESGDIDGDSLYDIVVASNGGWFYGVLYNDGTGNFSDPEYFNLDYPPLDIVCGDIDGNGRDDIAIAGNQTEIYYSFEDGFQSFLLSGTEHDIALADMDNDNDLDVVTIWGAFVSTVMIYENLGYSNFQTHTQNSLNEILGTLMLKDMDNDSLPDVFLAKTGLAHILYNNGNLSLGDMLSISISNPNYTIGNNYFISNIDNNGFKDIIVLKYSYETIPNLEILFNDGFGNFGPDPITNIESGNAGLKKQLKCYPNPFTTEINIEFILEVKSFAELSVYSFVGELVKTYYINQNEKGKQSIKWDGSDNGGKPCKPGPYLLTLKVNGDVLQCFKLIKY